MIRQFYNIKVTDLYYPSPEACRVTFDIPRHWLKNFVYQPGQHVIIRHNIMGKEFRRSYSLHSSPLLNEPLQITVKRVTDGIMSNYINDKLRAGDELELMPPQGRFYANIQHQEYKSYFLFAAGSSITPIFSILKSALHGSQNNYVYLFYGNRTEKSILFYDELNALLVRFPHRLKVIHSLTKPDKGWKGKTGRIDTESVEWFINTHVPLAQQASYFSCGPEKMNFTVRETLLNLDVLEELIRIEQFIAEKKSSQTHVDGVAQASLQVRLNGQNHQVVVEDGRTLLQAMKQANLDPPFSCESGICGTCEARLVKGKVDMKSHMALSEAEVNEGRILTCQSVALTKELKISF